MDRDRSPHIIVMYVLIVLLAAVLAYTAFKVVGMGSDVQGTWQCNQAVCSKNVDPQQWVSQYCARSIAPNGSEFMACTLNVEGVNTSIPLELINLSFVAQQCEVVTCVQEINVRATNYTVGVR